MASERKFVSDLCADASWLRLFPFFGGYPTLAWQGWDLPAPTRKNYCGVLATSPTLADPRPANETVAESASTSVTVASPILLVMVFKTLPVAGSFMVRPARLISNRSPTFNPDLLPAFKIRVLPLTSATRAFTSTLRVGRLPAAAVSCVPVETTDLFTASPRMVWPKFELLISKAPTPPPPPPPPPPSSEVPERVECPSPVKIGRAHV